MQAEIQTKSRRRVAVTSLMAYDAIRKSLTARREQVMDCFGDDLAIVLTREDICRNTNMKMCGVCGRVRELLDLGQLAVRGTRKDLFTDRVQTLVGLPTAEQRARFEAERTVESTL